jgi:hypothetical protein
MVWEAGFEPAQASNGFTDRPDSPNVGAPTWGDWPELNRHVQGHGLALYR